MADGRTLLWSWALAVAQIQGEVPAFFAFCQIRFQSRGGSLRLVTVGLAVSTETTRRPEQKILDMAHDTHA